MSRKACLKSMGPAANTPLLTVTQGTVTAGAEGRIEHRSGHSECRRHAAFAVLPACCFVGPIDIKRQPKHFYSIPSSWLMHFNNAAAAVHDGTCKVGTSLLFMKETVLCMLILSGSSLPCWEATLCHSYSDLLCMHNTIPRLLSVTPSCNLWTSCPHD